MSLSTNLDEYATAGIGSRNHAVDDDEKHRPESDSGQRRAGGWLHLPRDET